ncbi:MAG: M23 family metallopeptidase [Gemmatimonadaceae bacterium]|jgi:murein DD-endopeptidase MepM/ murein hydrolase activator NlpD|nr:M23 family metallopeptidase [Gemmatimonadaceae bacterium]
MPTPVRPIAALLRLAGVAAPLLAQPPVAPGNACLPDPDGPAVARSAFVPADRSPYVLPFEPGAAVLVWRTTSHFTPGNGGVGLYAMDFELPVGTPLVAARAGTVVAVRDSFRDGNGRDLEENYVMIRHGDSTVARYLHLAHRGALVRVGQPVRQGQRIALSGNTGETGGAHLHFDVQQCGPNLPPRYNALPCGMTVPVTFRNAGRNACGLEAGRRYPAR